MEEEYDVHGRMSGIYPPASSNRGGLGYRDTVYQSSYHQRSAYGTGAIFQHACMVRTCVILVWRTILSPTSHQKEPLGLVLDIVAMTCHFCA
jgi:hypothetical protein